MTQVASRADALNNIKSQWYIWVTRRSDCSPPPLSRVRIFDTANARNTVGTTYAPTRSCITTVCDAKGGTVGDDRACTNGVSSTGVCVTYNANMIADETVAIMGTNTRVRSDQ